MELPKGHVTSVIVGVGGRPGAVVELKPAPDPYPFDPNLNLLELERLYTLKAIEFFGGNKQRAARALGISVKTLYNKLHLYDVFERYKKKAKA